MPTINVEMMQQLLQEFTEKESLAGEEIKVIEQQIGELETRINVCRERLQYLNEDKDRLAVMMGRYVGGKNIPLANLGLEVSQSHIQDIVRKPDNKAVTANETADQNVQSDSSAGQSGVIEDLEPNNSEADAAQTANKESGNDDAIKSINDALKGLFRK